VPDVSHLRIWGCPAWMHVPKEMRVKLDPVARPCTFIGYTEGSKDGYRVLTPDGVIRISRDVEFDELFSTNEKSSSQFSSDLKIDNYDLLDETPAVPSAAVPVVPNGGAGGGGGGDSAGGSGADAEPVGADAEPVGADAEPVGALRRSSRESKPPVRYVAGAHSATMS
jgi:hypothetical protein